ncbi:hypothetical protein SKAU_G00149780 [Synaphobranchus kaupii]|uniref:Uncharacterized protein n=1 Tax=Synaphobranchus kaupii TaxID=118154 RepID=A0A9Q1FUZ0_SYNKA|nr:hypothetical protein SKAU_G00149780 [Synaphobranchus kaupii]
MSPPPPPSHGSSATRARRLPGRTVIYASTSGATAGQGNGKVLTRRPLRARPASRQARADPKPPASPRLQTTHRVPHTECNPETLAYSCRTLAQADLSSVAVVEDMHTMGSFSWALSDTGTPYGKRERERRACRAGPLGTDRSPPRKASVRRSGQTAEPWGTQRGGGAYKSARPRAPRRVADAPETGRKTSRIFPTLRRRLQYRTVRFASCDRQKRRARAGLTGLPGQGGGRARLTPQSGRVSGASRNADPSAELTREK